MANAKRKPDGESIKSATGAVASMKLVPVASQPKLAGADGAKDSAVDSETVVIRKGLLSLYQSEATETAQRGKLWISGHLAIFKAHSQEAIDESLKPIDRVKGSKTTTADQNISNSRVLYRAYLALPTDVFADCCKEGGRNVILAAVRAEMKARKELKAATAHKEELIQAARKLKIPEDQIQARVLETLQEEATLAALEKDAAGSPASKGKAQAARVAKSYTSNKVIDAAKFQSYCEAFAAEVKRILKATK